MAQIICESDDFEARYPVIYPQNINIDQWVSWIKDLRCWVKYFYAVSNIPELSRIKALQRCCNLLIRIFKIIWRHYYTDDEEEEDEDDIYAGLEKPDTATKLHYMQFIRATVMFFDWICL